MPIQGYHKCTGKGGCQYQWNYLWRDRCFKCNKFLGGHIPKGDTKPALGKWSGGAPRGGIPPKLSATQLLYQTAKALEDEGRMEEAAAIQVQLIDLKAAKFAAKAPWQQLQHKGQQLSKSIKALEAAQNDGEKLKAQQDDIAKKLEANEVKVGMLKVQIAKLEAEKEAAVPGAEGTDPIFGALGLIKAGTEDEKDPRLAQLNIMVAELRNLADTVVKDMEVKAKQAASVDVDAGDGSAPGATVDGGDTSADADMDKSSVKRGDVLDVELHDAAWMCKQLGVETLDASQEALLEVLQSQARAKKAKRG